MPREHEGDGGNRWSVEVTDSEVQRVNAAPGAIFPAGRKAPN
jgi:hypothetical protein